MAETCKTSCPTYRKCINRINRAETARQRLTTDDISPEDPVTTLAEQFAVFSDIAEVYRTKQEIESAAADCAGPKMSIIGRILYSTNYGAGITGLTLPKAHQEVMSEYMVENFPRCSSHMAKIALAGMPEIVMHTK